MEEPPQQNDIDESENGFDTRIQQLETEKKKMQEEFNMQRAKMKELFLQKENELQRKNAANVDLSEQIQQLKTELNDVKSQLVIAGLTSENNLEVEKRKAKEEIASLQQLVHETVEESSSSRSIYDTEVRKLQLHIQQLQQEVAELRSDCSPHHAQEASSLVPSAMLSAVTKKLVKKLGADTFTSQDGIEDRKFDGEHAQEDAEVLRSLVVPLEEEIKALKDKLRATDEELQRFKKGTLQGNESELIQLHDEPTTTDSKQQLLTTSPESQKVEPVCDMCSNYEAQLVKEQQRAAELEAKIVAAEKATERHREELLKEIGFRKDMEEKWNEKKEEHKQQVAELTRQVECAEQDLKEVQDMFKQKCSEIDETLSKLTKDREKVRQELIKLQNENDSLVGKYSVHSQQLQSEIINLPDSVEELQELLLKSHQDLIIAKIGKETAEEEANNLKSQILLLSDRISADQQEVDLLKRQMQQTERERLLWSEIQEKLEQSEQQLQASLAEMRMKLGEMHQRQETLERQNNELRTQVGSLQQELDTSETVQKDFVNLTQSLQIELEKIRDADTQVRWQHEEDIEECPTCKTPLGGKKGAKHHCRHCGTIFCGACLTRTVNSGPNLRPSKVCDVCHTLLVKSSAPYFSEVPPQN